MPCQACDPVPARSYHTRTTIQAHIHASGREETEEEKALGTREDIRAAASARGPEGGEVRGGFDGNGDSCEMAAFLAQAAAASPIAFVRAPRKVCAVSSSCARRFCRMDLGLCLQKRGDFSAPFQYSGTPSSNAVRTTFSGAWPKCPGSLPRSRSANDWYQPSTSSAAHASPLFPCWSAGTEGLLKESAKSTSHRPVPDASAPVVQASTKQIQWL